MCLKYMKRHGECNKKKKPFDVCKSYFIKHETIPYSLWLGRVLYTVGSLFVYVDMDMGMSLLNRHCYVPARI